MNPFSNHMLGFVTTPDVWRQISIYFGTPILIHSQAAPVQYAPWIGPGTKALIKQWSCVNAKAKDHCKHSLQTVTGELKLPGQLAGSGEKNNKTSSIIFMYIQTSL